MLPATSLVAPSICAQTARARQACGTRVLRVCARVGLSVCQSRAFELVRHAARGSRSGAGRCLPPSRVSPLKSRQPLQTAKCAATAVSCCALSSLREGLG